MSVILADWLSCDPIIMTTVPFHLAFRLWLGLFGKKAKIIISGSLQSASAAACKPNPWSKTYPSIQYTFYLEFDLEVIILTIGTFYMNEWTKSGCWMMKFNLCYLIEGHLELWKFHMESYLMIIIHTYKTKLQFMLINHGLAKDTPRS